MPYLEAVSAPDFLTVACRRGNRALGGTQKRNLTQTCDAQRGDGFLEAAAFRDDAIRLPPV